MYQKCPICEGSGKVFTPDLTSMYKQCDVCNGQKIINTRNGLPPVTQQVNTINTQTFKIDPLLNKNHRQPSIPGSGERLTVPDLTNSHGHQLEYD